MHRKRTHVQPYHIDRAAYLPDDCKLELVEGILLVIQVVDAHNRGGIPARGWLTALTFGIDFDEGAFRDVHFGKVGMNPQVVGVEADVLKSCFQQLGCLIPT